MSRIIIVPWQVALVKRRHFKTLAVAHRFLDHAEAVFKATNKVADSDIWTSIEIIYETRWDCPTARLAAAHRIKYCPICETNTPFAVGETVYCIVRGQRGIPMRVTAVKGYRIKTAGFGAWCPRYNFQREPT